MSYIYSNTNTTLKVHNLDKTEFFFFFLDGDKTEFFNKLLIS